MAQVFPKGYNVVMRLAVLSVPFTLAGGAAFGAAFYRSDYTTNRGEVVQQPIPFSHKHHVSQLGIGCQYCHTSVEVSSSSGYPPTKTCMNCHQQMWQGAELLDPVRQSYANGDPIAWTKIHNVPHYTYFNHSIHVNKGVGCYSCHGPIDQMNLIYQENTLLMEWCLNCHRNPEAYLRPREEIYNMTYKASDTINPDTNLPYDQITLGKKLKEDYKVRDHYILTNCSICHR